MFNTRKKMIIAVKNFPVPKTQKNVKQFLSSAGHYRRFIDGFSQNCESFKSTS